MVDQLPAAGGSDWFGNWISSGKIPGAVKAIAQLVGSTADAGSAWISIATAKANQIERGIKDQTSAQGVVTAALAKAAAKHAVADVALVERAANQWAEKQIKHQINREKIAEKTIEILTIDDQYDSDFVSPSEDWMNIFEGHAERASSEKMQDLWARILGGEIRKTGVFSLRTLSFVATLDSNIAQDFEFFCSYITNGSYIAGDKRFDWTPLRERLNLMIECGLISDSRGKRWDLDANGRLFQYDKNNGLMIEGMPDGELALDIFPLTKIGLELYGIITPAYDIDIQRETASIFLGCKNIKSVSICEPFIKDGKLEKLIAKEQLMKIKAE